jgi:hypothetical protein
MNPNNLEFPSRRKLLSLGVAAGVVTCLDGSEATYTAEPSDQAALHEVNVKSFGAVGDAVADDTVQRALDADHKAQGGVAYAPPGRYLFRGSSRFPTASRCAAHSPACHRITESEIVDSPNRRYRNRVVSNGRPGMRSRRAVSCPEHQQFCQRPNDLLSRADCRWKSRCLSVGHCDAGQESRGLRSGAAQSLSGHRRQPQ